MDFYNIKEKEAHKKGTLEIYPDFKVVRSKDLMVRGKSFYAIWDEKKNLWSTDEYDVQRLVDADITNHQIYTPGVFPEVHRKYLENFSSSSWLQFRNYVNHVSDTHIQLDENLTFANSEVKKEDYVSRRLPYALEEGDISAWDELVGVLYDEENRAKIEWAVGAIVSGDSKTIQKFLVFYGGAGTGKSTILNIITWLFQGYIAMFDAKALTSNNNSFATEAFKTNPLVAIQHDGDMSKIEDNTKLNSIVSHEYMTMNEKFKPSYDARINAMLLVASNKAVKITDAKSGLIRRMIDVQPTGNLVSPRKYQALMSQIQFELGAIAAHCLKVYRDMGKDFYSTYRPVEMMLQTDVFFNYIEAHYDIFSDQDGVSLKQAYDLYKVWYEEAGVDWKMPLHKFREELKNYFHQFEERAEVGGLRVRSWYSGFNADRFKVQTKQDDMVFSLVMDSDVSLLDERYASYLAQYSNKDGNPTQRWTEEALTDEERKKGYKPVTTVLSDLDTSKEHYVDIEDEHEVVIDFDLEDEDGNKSAEKNLEAASQWPATYAEWSRSETGIHLHYYYDGDVSELVRLYEPGIEIKVYTGSAALRRKFSKGNNVPVATLKPGQLPVKEKKDVVYDEKRVKSERGLRNQIEKNLQKQVWPSTKSSMDFIYQIFEDAYKDGLEYDLTDMRPAVMAFALNSTHQADYCLKLLGKIHFASEHKEEDLPQGSASDSRYAIFDVEVFKNLFVIVWKFVGGNKVVMINPSPQEVAEVMKLKLIGYNNRRYDNHILYAAAMGYDNLRLYKVSKALIGNSPNSGFREAYGLSYADIYDLSSEKKSLKMWQILLGLKHQELGLDWDEPVPEELWQKVAEYCGNDVDSTEEVLIARNADFIARQILSDLSGLPVNATTQQHASKIIFGNSRDFKEQFVYTDLSEMFPGYKYELGKSTYKGEEVGEGGLVRSKPGMYRHVAVLDVTSMHPTSIEALNLFGQYTQHFSAIKQARIAIKRGDLALAKTLLGGILEKHLVDGADLDALSYALKIVINSVYGLTSARFDNAFKDPRNIDNIVAKRGALFMMDLRDAVEAKGFSAIHIKTDSIKIPDATPEIIQFVMDFGAQYGYEFEHEATYEKFCLVNDAVFVAKYEDGKKAGQWTSTGAQFIHPYVFKTMFSKEKIVFKDLCEAKSVQTALYLDFTDLDKPMVDVQMKDLHFVGKSGEFCPIQPGKGGARLVRQDGTDKKKFHSATGAKNYIWLESDFVKEHHKEKDIDMSYFDNLVDEAIKNISQYGDYESFVS